MAVSCHCHGEGCETDRVLGRKEFTDIDNDFIAPVAEGEVNCVAEERKFFSQIFGIEDYLKVSVVVRIKQK